MGDILFMQWQWVQLISCEFPYDLSKHYVQKLIQNQSLILIILMLDPHEDQFLETVAIVLQDLECFISQKNNQALIYALLQIKRTARKARGLSPHSVSRNSNASHSQHSYSQRKGSISGHSIGKSSSKESQASFDIIKGAQIFNSTRRKGIPSKLYTQTHQPQPQYFAHEIQQPSTLSQPSQRNSHPLNKVHTTVPKLVGLVSSDQISDIQQPFGIESRNYPKPELRHYQNSIQEVDDDDDEFQDIVLNRLDVIEQKVNQMLRQKKHQRLSTLNSRAPQSHSYHLSKSKLQNVGSGPNILYSKHPNNTPNNLYQYPESHYPNSTALMSPRVYTFHNSKNTSVQPSSKKMANSNFKQNLTDRNTNLQKAPIAHHYFTDHQNQNEHYARQRYETHPQFINDQIYEEEQEITKSKKLGHYRESSRTLHEREEGEEIERPNERLQRVLETTINFAKIKEQAIDDKAFKYIPLSKINQNKTHFIQQKTQRQITRRNQDPRQANNKNAHTLMNKTHTVMVEKVQKNYETSSQKHPQAHYEQQSLKGAKTRKDEKYRSGRDSGVRMNNLNGSEVRAYTEHGDYVKNEEELSVASEKDIYSEIRELREITRLYGAERSKRQTNNEGHRPGPVFANGVHENEYQGYDYRHHQKTERPKYPFVRNHTHENEYEEEEQVVIQGNYPQERLVKVVKKIPHYPTHVQQPQGQRGQNARSNRIPHRTQLLQYETHQQVAYEQPYPTSYANPVYVVRQRQLPAYEQVSELYDDPYYHEPADSQVQTMVLKEDKGSKLSQRKMSSGSMHSYKSIPYVRTEGNPSLKHQKSIEYVVERPMRYSQAPVYKDY